MRKQRQDIKRLRSARYVIELNPGQSFYETKAAFEIWRDDPPLRLWRVPKKRILFVETA